MEFPDNSFKPGLTQLLIRRMTAAAILTVGAVGVVVLFLFNPEEHGAIYPQCWLHKFTGLDCPGCGSLRALHQLTHGHLVTAFRFNPLLVLLLPVAVWMAVCELTWQATGKKLPGITMRPWSWWLLLVVIILFGIGRNLAMFGGRLG